MFCIFINHVSGQSKTLSKLKNVENLFWHVSQSLDDFKDIEMTNLTEFSVLTSRNSERVFM